MRRKAAFFFVPKQFHSRPGLTDGLFSNQNRNFGQILDGLEMERFGIFLAL
jgi:hypothetical protein